MTVSSTTTKTPSAATPIAAAATTPAAAAAAAASTGASPASATPDTYTNPNSVLNQNDFLQLLVAQIQYQDPMNPQSDTDMAAQMAQFTTLQQTTQSTNSLAMMQANSLIGSNVTVQVDSKTTANGVVSGVVLSSGTPEITINGTDYSLSQVTAVVPAATTSASGASGTTTPTGSTGSSSTTGDTTDSTGTTGTSTSTTQNSN